MTPSTSWWFIHVLCWRKTLDDTQINNLYMSTTRWSFITNAQMWRQRTNEFQLNCILISSGVISCLSFTLRLDTVQLRAWNQRMWQFLSEMRQKRQNQHRASCFHTSTAPSSGLQPATADAPRAHICIQLQRPHPGYNSGVCVCVCLKSLFILWWQIIY